jgi:radical SAM superfamily enzyme YgiQ (UPF0313 family)
MESFPAPSRRGPDGDCPLALVRLSWQSLAGLAWTCALGLFKPIVCGTAGREVERMFQHVLCMYPYRREIGDFGFCPPIGLELIATVLKPHSRAIDVVDLRKDSRRTVDFLRPETDLVCLSVNWDRDAAFLQEEIRSVPGRITTMVGGRHASEDPGRWLAACPDVDIVVRGDGEEAAEEYSRGVPLEEIRGISFRKAGEIVHNPVRRLGPVRDDLYPDRTLRRHQYPIYLSGASIGLEIDSLAGSRGCPFNCTFCSFSRNPWGEKRGWSARSPESIVKELEEIRAPIVAFTDDIFTHDMDRVERICDLILARKIRKKFIINARLEIARRPETIRKMERAGFTMLLLGIESAQDKTLRSMRKGFDTAKIREYFQVLRHTSMFLHGYFILGNIGETAEEMLQIGPFAQELGIDTLGLSDLRVSPYSGLEELVAQHPNYHISESGKIYSDELSTSEIRAIRRRIMKQFLTPRQVLRLVGKGLRQGGALPLLPKFLPRVPGLLLNVAIRSRQRARKRARRSALVPTQAVVSGGRIPAPGGEAGK